MIELGYIDQSQCSIQSDDGISTNERPVIGDSCGLTKVYQMCNCVKPGLTKDQPANNFMEVNAVIQGQFVRQAHVTQECHQVAEDEDEADHGVEQDGSACNIFRKIKKKKTLK